MTMNRLLLLCCAALLCLCLLPATGACEEGHGRKAVFSINPLLAMFSWYTGELEIALAPTTTAGVAGSYLAFGDEDDGDEETYTNGSIFLRYYPERSFEGFFFGVRAGYYSVTDQEEELSGNDDSEGVMGVGIDIGYGWLLGYGKRISVSAGVGAVRLFGGDLDAADTTLPTIRLINVGFAF